MDSSILLLLGAAVFVGIILLAVITFTRKGIRSLNVEKYRERWLSIEQSVDQSPASQQMAILNADKLLDQAMREKGMAGTTMGERLKASRSHFSDLNGLWAAHKIRNRIAHEEDVKLSQNSTKQALAKFKTALRDIGAL